MMMWVWIGVGVVLAWGMVALKSAVVLGLLRNALGAEVPPPALILIISGVLSLVVLAPVIEQTQAQIGGDGGSGLATVAGEDGVVFGQEASGISAFSAATGAVYWTHPDAGALVAARPGHGAVANLGATLRIFDDNGLPSDVPHVSDSQVWRGGASITTDARLAVISGPSLDRPYFQHGSPEQAGPRTRSSHAPTVVNVLPYELLKFEGDVYTALSFKADFTDLVPEPGGREYGVPSNLGLASTHRMRDASLANFSDAIGSDVWPISPAAAIADAVAFIGHSFAELDVQGSVVLPHASVGLEFFDVDLFKIRGTPPLYNDVTYQWKSAKPGRGESTAFRADRIRFSARVIFIGSCWGGPTFESLWDVDNDTKHRALILHKRPGEAVDLYHAAWAWRLIANRLARGWTVGEAVEAANLIVGLEQEYKVIGNANLQIHPRRY